MAGIHKYVDSVYHSTIAIVIPYDAFLCKESAMALSFMRIDEEKWS